MCQTRLASEVVSVFVPHANSSFRRLELDCVDSELKSNLAFLFPGFYWEELTWHGCALHVAVLWASPFPLMGVRHEQITTTDAKKSSFTRSPGMKYACTFPVALRDAVASNDTTMTMTMTHSEKSHIGQMRAWPYRQECRGHGPTKKNLSYR